MKKTLKINGTGILNFIDLKNEFSLWQLYDSLEEFRHFAAVHCVPLQSMLYREDRGFYRAKYLTKAFWLSVIEKSSSEDFETGSAEDFLKAFLKKRYLSAMSSKDSENALSMEYSDAKVHKKILYTADNAELGDSAEDKRRCLLLIAVCELSEKNILDMQIRRRGNTEEKSIGFLPADEVISLTAQDEPYKYFYHESDILEDGETIRTSLIKAKAGVNRYKTVTIEIYRETSEQPAERAVLKPGEYLWCNSAGGKVIKFLPSASISDERCMIRRDYSKPDISIISAETKWTLEEDCSSFSTGNESTGFLCVSGGKLNTAFYHRAKDHMIQLKLNTIIRRVVEVMVYEDGCEILTEDGNIITDTIGRETSTRVVSLDKNSRLPLLKTGGTDGARETAVSVSHLSAAVICESEKDCKVFFGTPECHIDIIGGKVVIPDKESE